MLEYDIWLHAMEDLEAELREIENKMLYRKRKLVGPVSPSVSHQRLTEEQEKILSFDKELIILQDTLERTRMDLAYLKCTGDLPEYRKGTAYEHRV